MGNSEDLKFAERMNQVADLLGIPEKGKNRQKIFGERFGVSQESARKWLSGISTPKESKFLDIIKAAKVNYEWLKTGRGEMRGTSNNETHISLEREEVVQYDNIKDFQKYVDRLKTSKELDQVHELLAQFVVLPEEYKKEVMAIVNRIYKLETGLKQVARQYGRRPSNWSNDSEQSNKHKKPHN